MKLVPEKNKRCREVSKHVSLKHQGLLRKRVL